MIHVAKFLTFMFFSIHISSWAMNAEQDELLPVLTDSMTPEDWRNFARKGGAYYHIPEPLRQYIPKMLELASSISTWRGRPGYHCDDKHQIEFLHSEQQEWGNYPEEVQELALGMRNTAVSVLNSLLQALEIDTELYSQITGGLSDVNGKHFLKVMHYDALKPYPGLPWHKDIRWITVLFVNQAGLEGKIGNIVVPIQPLEGYFFINLGVFFEAFINDPAKLTALVHQVKQVNDDRISFGVFVEGNYPRKGFYQTVHNSVVWKDAEEMKAFLLEDKQQSFSSGPHNIFSSFSEK